MKAVVVVGLVVSSVGVARADKPPPPPPFGDDGLIYLGAAVPIVFGAKGFGPALDLSFPIGHLGFGLGGHVEFAGLSDGDATRGMGNTSYEVDNYPSGIGFEVGAYVIGQYILGTSKDARMVLNLGAGIHDASPNNAGHWGTTGAVSGFALRPEVALEMHPIRISVGYAHHFGPEIDVPANELTADHTYSADTITVGIGILLAPYPD